MSKDSAGTCKILAIRPANSSRITVMAIPMMANRTIEVPTVLPALSGLPSPMCWPIITVEPIQHGNSILVLCGCAVKVVEVHR